MRRRRLLTGDNLYNIDFFKEHLRLRQTRKRFIHSLNVADAAVELAKIYGEDTEKAYVAGLLHDICKDMEHSEQRSYALECRYPMTREEARCKQLWHAVAGAQYSFSTFGVEDEDILRAIRYHTVGRPDMSRLEEIIYVADLVSIERKYRDAARIRKLAQTDLNAAILEILRFSVECVARKCGVLPILTAEAYNQYIFVCESMREIKESES